MLSGKLASIYEKKFSATNEATRKAISRERTPVQKIKTFPFTNNQVFCYLEEQFTKSIYRENLYDALKKYSASISPILTAMENFEGYMSQSILPLYSASPTENTKGHRLFKRNIDDLLECGILVVADEQHYSFGAGYGEKMLNVRHSLAKERISRIVMEDVMAWAAKINLVAFNCAKIYPTGVEFAHFQWFATCPSYIQPIYDLHSDRPGMLVADILYKRHAEVADVTFFVEKVNIIRHFKGIVNVVPFFVVESLSEEALRYLKESKVIVGIISNLFDQSYADTLAGIYNTFNNATAIIYNEPEKIDELLRMIEKNEGRFNNAIGALFECIVGLFYQRKGVNYLELNKQIQNDRGSYFELDVMASQGNIVTVVECKATKSAITEEYVEKWLSTRLPVFKKWINEVYGGKSIVFQIWSIGGFDKGALELLEKHKNMVSPSKYRLEYFDRTDIIQLAKEEKDDVLMRQIEQHFSFPINKSKESEKNTTGF